MPHRDSPYDAVICLLRTLDEPTQGWNQRPSERRHRSQATASVPSRQQRQSSMRRCYRRRDREGDQRSSSLPMFRRAVTTPTLRLSATSRVFGRRRLVVTENGVLLHRWLVGTIRRVHAAVYEPQTVPARMKVTASLQQRR